MKIKALLYCTKNKWRLFFDKVKQVFTLGKVKSNNDLNGKIVAECDYEVEWYDTSWCCGDFIEHKGLEKSCLTKEQLFDYVKGRNEFYAIHIKNLHIFDETKELSEYDYYQKYNRLEPIEKAPQNMMRAYSSENMEENYILISIQSQWLCKILNGEKNVEIRKKVLKEMLNNE